MTLGQVSNAEPVGSIGVLPDGDHPADLLLVALEIDSHELNNDYSSSHCSRMSSSLISAVPLYSHSVGTGSSSSGQ